MHLCTCVGEEGGDGEGAGEGGDTKAGASPLELPSLDTHRREVAGAQGEMLHAETQMSIPHKYEQACSAPDTVAAGAQASHKQTSIQSRPKISGVLHFATACTRRSSSDLLHNASRSGTEKAMDSAVRHAKSCRMVHHPSTGLNLLMSGTDLLSGQRILCGKEE